MIDYTRVYTGRARVAHLLDENRSPNSSHPAVCGMSPFPYYWQGTGSWVESDLAARLPLCKTCHRVIRPLLDKLAADNNRAALNKLYGIQEAA